jgi:hypothetical protein
MDTAKEADRRGYASCMRVFGTLCKREREVISEFHGMDVNIPFPERVGTVASVTGLDVKDVCGILARINTKLAEARGLI